MELDQQLIIEQMVSAAIKRLIHDLRSPLAALKMLSSYSKDLSERDKPLLENIASRIEQIIESEDKNATDMGSLKINVHTTITKILLEKKMEYHSSNVQFIYAPNRKTENISIKGNIGDFERMLSNLLNNAVEACVDKSGIIILDLECHNNRLHLTIDDNGNGIPNEVLQKLRNGNSITHGKENGQGIGFTQIRNTVTKLNCELDIESKLGAGTKISIMFNSR